MRRNYYRQSVCKGGGQGALSLLHSVLLHSIWAGVDTICVLGGGSTSINTARVMKWPHAESKYVDTILYER